MKIARLIFNMLMVMVILVGCSSNTEQSNIEEKIFFSDQLIYGKSNVIDLVQIDYKLEGTKQWEDSKQWEDVLIIDQLIEQLQGIELRQLTVDEEMALFREKEILYTISLISRQSPGFGKEAKGGVVVIFSTGELFFPDIKTMDEGRTVSFINVNEEEENMKSILSFINSLGK